MISEQVRRAIDTIAGRNKQVAAAAPEAPVQFRAVHALFVDGRRVEAGAVVTVEIETAIDLIGCFRAELVDAAEADRIRAASQRLAAAFDKASRPRGGWVHNGHNR